MQRKRRKNWWGTANRVPTHDAPDFAVSSVRERGMAAIAVIVCLIIVTALGATLVLDLKASWEDFRQSRMAIQADWLAASALDRVRSRLESNPSYDGEVWTINADQLDGRSSAEIRIDILRPEEAKKNITAKVTIQLQANGRSRLSVTRIIPIEVVKHGGITGEGQPGAN